MDPVRAGVVDEVTPGGAAPVALVEDAVPSPGGVVAQEGPVVVALPADQGPVGEVDVVVGEVVGDVAEPGAGRGARLIGADAEFADPHRRGVVALPW